MQALERVKTTSRVLRYLVIAFGALIVSGVGVALFASGQNWLSVGDEQLAVLVQSGAISGSAAAALLVPVGVFFILGIYWLQRLFGPYAAGCFFSDASMTCYLWLVWLKVASFAYQLLLPLISASLAQSDGPIDASIVIDAGTVAELTVLLLIVHILREAQRINEENKGFV